jgi:hypothetical protein
VCICNVTSVSIFTLCTRAFSVGFCCISLIPYKRHNSITKSSKDYWGMRWLIYLPTLVLVIGPYDLDEKSRMYWADAPKSLGLTCNPLKCKRKKNHLDCLKKKLDPSPHIRMKPYLLCTCKLIAQANVNIEPCWNLHWQKQGYIVKHKLTNSPKLAFFLPCCCQPTIILVFGPINSCIC